jgi:hypothetical protein|tara:strand:+ start:11338 stop:11913 length:576 start_codon:yes stop_codon:yes gene_type:complete
LDEKEMKKIIIWLAFIIVLMLASITRGDLYVYDLEATLTESNVTYVDQEPFYYDIFHIQTDGYATLAFDNYDADLGSSNSNYDFNDPYLYLYEIEQHTLNGFSGGSVQLTLFDEDDDGNEDSPEGLYFYLDDVQIHNQLVAVISSYDPYVVGTVDFTVTSDQPLSIIPEAQAISLILLGGASLLIAKRKMS